MLFCGTHPYRRSARSARSLIRRIACAHSASLLRLLRDTSIGRSYGIRLRAADRGVSGGGANRIIWIAAAWGRIQTARERTKHARQ